MRVFVTGASGFIGRAVVTELLGAGHEVLGLARSDDAAATVAAAGAQVHRGDLDDVASLRAGAADADGVVHLAFNHDFAQHDAAAQTDLVAVEAIGDVLAGSDRPLVIASGLAGLAPGRIATERDRPDLAQAPSPRVRTAQVTLELAERGVRSSVLRLPPSVHGEGDHGFVWTLIQIARERGTAGYVADGSNRWPAVHRLDAARLFRLALEHAPAGSVLHATGDDGVPTRTIAELIGRHLGLATESVAPADAADRFGWIGRVLSLDCAATSELTRELLDWQPTQIGLVEDIDQGHYFAL